jgi:cytidylate kinase
VTAPPLIVAIDGPAGVGKSTVARRLARRLGVPYLDTGAMYRALACELLALGIEPDDRDAVAAALPGIALGLRLRPDGDAEVLVAGRALGEDLRTPEVTEATSRVAVHPEVRARLSTLQRELARRHGGVIEGRDIGTRVVPEAPFKFYFDAPAPVRAERRLAELRAAGRAADAAEVARDIEARDRRDRSREHSPLAPAATACPVDTSAGTADEIVELLLARIVAGGP